MKAVEVVKGFGLIRAVVLKGAVRVIGAAGVIRYTDPM